MWTASIGYCPMISKYYVRIITIHNFRILGWDNEPVYLALVHWKVVNIDLVSVTRLHY